MRRTAAVGTIALAVAVQACTMAGGGPCTVYIWPLDGGMPDLEMMVGDTVETPLEDHFRAADRECIRAQAYDLFRTRSSVPAAVAVSILDLPVLRVVALDVADSVRVIVAENYYGQGRDDYGYGIGFGPGHDFLVRVRPHPESR